MLVDPDDEMLSVVPDPSIDSAGVAVLETINDPPEIERVEPLCELSDDVPWRDIDPPESTLMIAADCNIT